MTGRVGDEPIAVSWRPSVLAASTTEHGLATEPSVGEGTQQWMNAHGDLWVQLGSLLDRMPTSINTGDDAQVASLRTTCADIDAWATRMNDTEAVPDPALDEELGNMIDDAWSFSEDCLDGIDRRDVDLLQQSIDHFSDFQDHVANFISQAG